MWCYVLTVQLEGVSVVSVLAVLREQHRLNCEFCLFVGH